MKKMFLLIASFMFAQGLYAHPAKSVELKIDAAKKVLNVTAVHQVYAGTSKKHYIELISMTVNGDKKTVVENKFTEQKTEAASQVTSFDISKLKKGDKVEVLAVCSKGGSKTATIEIQ